LVICREVEEVATHAVPEHRVTTPAMDNNDMSSTSLMYSTNCSSLIFH
jgi:hypothetical protein